MSTSRSRFLWPLLSRSAWTQRWHETEGLGETVGAVFGILLLVFGLTGSLSAFRLWQTHQALEHAASIALRSEEQQGCWTTATSQAVATAAQGAGLNPQGIKITRSATQTAEYGQPVSVTLAYTTNTDFLFGGLGTWTEQAAISGSSFYVPAVVTGSQAGCAAPTMLSGSGSGSGSSGMTPSSALQVTLSTSATETLQQTYTATGVVNGGNVELPNTLVTLSDGANTLGSATTNNAGQYSISFTAPASGSYTFTATADGVTASQAVTVVGRKISLAAAASEIAETYYTATGSLTAGGNGVSGQTVSLSDGSQTLGSATTDSAGSYAIHFQAPASGSYTYTAQGGGAQATQTVTVANGCSTATSSASPTVTAVSFSTGGSTLTAATTVTVTGTNLPILLAQCDSGTVSLSGGRDYPNFLLTTAPPSVVQQGGYNKMYSYWGNPSMPYASPPMWGVQVQQSTATSLTFTVPNTPGSIPGPWYFYLVPDGQTLSLSTPYTYEYPPATGLVQGGPTIPIFSSGTALATDWSVNGGVSSFSAGSYGQPASFGGWVNGQGATVTYHFVVPTGDDPKLAYGLAQGMYKNNSAPVTVTLNGQTVASYNNVGGDGTKTQSNETIWEKTLTSGTYTLSVQGSMFNVYGLWTNKPQDITLVSAPAPSSFTSAAGTGTGLNQWLPEYGATSSTSSWNPPAHDVGEWAGIYENNGNQPGSSVYETYSAPSGTTMTTLQWQGYNYNGAPVALMPTIWALVQTSSGTVRQNVWQLPTSVSTGNTTSTQTQTLTLPAHTVGIAIGAQQPNTSAGQGWTGRYGWDFMVNTPQITLSNGQSLTF